MKKLCVGDKYKIQCYKHNGDIYRASEAILLDIEKDYLVFGNNKTLLIKSDGNSWRTKEPAILYFYKDSWYNTIAQLKKNGVTYYSNIASPYIIEDDAIKYIDYDLDLRVYSTGEYKVLDKQEYKEHKREMNYSAELEEVIKYSLTELINLYKDGHPSFNKEKNIEYYSLYLKLHEEERNSNFSA